MSGEPTQIVANANYPAKVHVFGQSLIINDFDKMMRMISMEKRAAMAWIMEADFEASRRRQLMDMHNSKAATIEGLPNESLYKTTTVEEGVLVVAGATDLFPKWETEAHENELFRDQALAWLMKHKGWNFQPPQ